MCLPKVQTALVTGASRGLGFEWVKQLSEKKWKVYAACRAGADAPSLASLGATVIPVALDVSDAASVAKLSEVLDGVALDLLVNNAGIRPEECGPDKKLGDIDYAAMESVLKTNAVGPMRVMSACLPALSRAGAFKVVNISSALGSCALAAHTRKAFHNIAGTDLAYRSSKAALNMATALSALELSETHPQSVVVTMDPGWVATDMGLRGGKDAPPLTAVDAVRMNIERMEGLTPADTGTYVSGPRSSPAIQADGSVRYDAAVLLW